VNGADVGLVDDAVEADVGSVAEEPELPERRGPLDGAEPEAVGHMAGVVGQLAEDVLPGHRGQVLVGVDVEDPVPCGPIEAEVARRREVTVPLAVEDDGAEGLGHDDRLVNRARVDDHDLVDDGADGGQAATQVSGFVPDDEGGGEPRGVGGAAHRAQTFVTIVVVGGVVVAGGAVVGGTWVTLVSCTSGSPETRES